MDPADLYQQTFRLEADELLGEIEAVILLIEENPEDDDAINRLFRAVHTHEGVGRHVRPDRHRELLAWPGIRARQGAQQATAGQPRADRSHSRLSRPGGDHAACRRRWRRGGYATAPRISTSASPRCAHRPAGLRRRRRYGDACSSMAEQTPARRHRASRNRRHAPTNRQHHLSASASPRNLHCSSAAPSRRCCWTNCAGWATAPWSPMSTTFPCWKMPIRKAATWPGTSC